MAKPTGNEVNDTLLNLVPNSGVAVFRCRKKKYPIMATPKTRMNGPAAERPYACTDCKRPPLVRALRNNSEENARSIANSPNRFFLVLRKDFEIK
jgi:hypothetical protein